MINFGKFNELKIVRQGSPGYYLDAGTKNTSDDILLPYGSALDKELKVDDVVNAFIYRDSKDRIIATLKKPLATVGDIAYLEVKDITTIGAFIDIGLERDVFVPMKEQRFRLIKGRKYLFYIYVDKTNRLAATPRLEEKLEMAEGINLGDEVLATVYAFYKSENIAVAIDEKYKGIMLKNECFTKVRHGDKLNLYVRKIYEDGTLGLTPRLKAKDERNKLQDEILNYLKENDGFMPFNDKSSPEDIKDTFHESKNYFKRALGGLMKKGLIKQDDKGTTLIKK